MAFLSDSLGAAQSFRKLLVILPRKNSYVVGGLEVLAGDPEEVFKENFGGETFHAALSRITNMEVGLSL